MQRANITSTTKNPSGGEIERDENGEPNGLLIDNAQKLVMPLIPTVTRKEQDAFVLGTKVYASRGWTGTHDADSLPISDVLSYEKLDLNFRVHFSLTKNDYLFCKQGQKYQDLCGWCTWIKRTALLKTMKTRILGSGFA